MQYATRPTLLKSLKSSHTAVTLRPRNSARRPQTTVLDRSGPPPSQNSLTKFFRGSARFSFAVASNWQSSRMVVFLASLRFRLSIGDPSTEQHLIRSYHARSFVLPKSLPISRKLFPSRRWRWTALAILGFTCFPLTIYGNQLINRRSRARINCRKYDAILYRWWINCSCSQRPLVL